LAASALRFEQVHAYYGDSHVLHGVSLACGEGRLVAVLGRNGAGKSTCMSTIVGLLAPRPGVIEVFGRAIGGWAPEQISALGVALVPQGRRVFRSLTVQENLDVAGQRARGGRLEPWTAKRVFQMFPRLEERQAQYAGSLSGGEQQMLAIGRALMGNPRLLLMDEPSEGLAPQIVAEVGRTITRLKDEGLSIVLVEQNIRLALQIADEVAILNSGRSVHQGPARSLSMDHDLITQNLGVH
jgi:branched-chain amino acid transport system ATP-binding protein